LGVTINHHRIFDVRQGSGWGDGADASGFIAARCDIKADFIGQRTVDVRVGGIDRLTQRAVSDTTLAVIVFGGGVHGKDRTGLGVFPVYCLYHLDYGCRSVTLTGLIITARADIDGLIDWQIQARELPAAGHARA